MKNLKVLIEVVEVTDVAGRKAVQKKINNWLSTELISKYEIHTTDSHIVFNICLKKAS